MGSLGLIPQQHLTENLQLRFVNKQKKAFIIIALLTALVAVLLSLPLARQAVKESESSRTGELEPELQITRESHQTTIEELESGKRAGYPGVSVQTP